MASEDKQETKQDIEASDDDKDEDSLLQTAYPNQVSLSRARPLSYYVGRAKRILRHEDSLTVKGRSTTMSLACTLVEILKRQKIAKVTKLKTNMDTLPYFVGRGDARWAPPTATITIELERDSLAEYVSDFQQRKVIDIFESQKENLSNGTLNYSTDENTGAITVHKVGTKDEKDLSVVFKTEEEHLKTANEFLDTFNKAGNKIGLPDFIKYVSHLIHPLLRDKHFKTMIAELGDDSADTPGGDDQGVENADEADIEDLN